MQVVRLETERLAMVLASDATQYYENMEAARPFPVVFDVGAMIEGWDTLRRLASSPDAIIPGHDPLVLERYPASAPGCEGVAARLDLGRL
jgi:glyoxylase-like metal-dependent hydrolase (beta-lactamase superfamily II)